MSFTVNGHIRDLVLLDTNIIREIIRNLDKEDKSNIISKNLFSNFSPDKYGFCISIYSTFELLPYDDIYMCFLDMFSIYPFFLIKPFNMIEEEEKNAASENKDLQINNLAYAITPATKDKEWQFRNVSYHLIENNEIYKPDYIREELEDIVNHWKKDKNKVNKLMETVSSMYKKDIEENFHTPSQKILKYSYYSRIFDNRKISPSDVMDVRISAIAPYVDVVITEKYQAGVFRQAQNKIDEIQNLRIYTLKDLKHEEIKIVER